MNEDMINEIKKILGDKPLFAYVRSFGCKLNISDGEKIKGLLVRMKYSLTEDETSADIIILNTCAVRESAENRVLGILGNMKKLKKQKPSLIIGITGCMTAQKHITEKIRKSYSQVDFVVGTSALNNLTKLLLNCIKGEKFGIDIVGYDDFSEITEPIRESTFKANIPIMFGCNNFCTYCIVPYVRGSERSRKMADIVAEVEELINNGYKEIMLLGQNVNSYGNDFGYENLFPKLLRRLNAIEGKFIIRFMSSHPNDVSQELIDTMFDCKKVAKHLHLPLQSGSNNVLQRMNRRYTAEKYLYIVDMIRQRDPKFSLTTDIIVGFPNESDKDFAATLNIIKQVKYDNIYSFIYSKRFGTPAAEMDDIIIDETKRCRVKELLEIQRRISIKNYKRFIGKMMCVLAEDVSKKQSRFIFGKSNEFIIVKFEGDKSLIGQFVNVEITEAMNGTLVGKIVKTESESLY